MEIFFYLALLSTFLLIIASNLIFKSQPKNPPPSPPFALPVVGHLHLLKKPLHRCLSDLANRYGPVLLLRFGSRPVLIISSPSAVEECFTKNDIVFANRPRLLAGKHLGYDHTTLVWAPYGPHWRNLRRVTTVEIFSSNRIHTFSSIHNEEIRSMVQRLYRGQSDLLEFRKVELKQLFFEVVLNVIMRMTAGKRYYGDNEDVANSQEARQFREIVEETFLVSGASNLLDFLPVLRWVDFGGVEKRLERLKRKRDEFLQGLIDEKRRTKDPLEEEEEEVERKKIFIDALLSLQESDPEYYTDEIIKGIIM